MEVFFLGKGSNIFQISWTLILLALLKKLIN